ncbi:MAG: MFS transporter [Candidatus Hydrogenedentes bacterium]|nr:MFS transporter [Candidatus Hydrogenedentota bacterium]
MSVKLHEKVAFGLGGIALTLPDIVFTQWIFMRYAPDEQDALVKASVFGIVFLTARVVGAVAEPLIGYWSDSCRSKWGRRMPFVRFGLVPLAILFFLMWCPPVKGLSLINAIYAYLVIQLYLLFYPGVLTPYLSLLTEIGNTSQERVGLMTAQGVFVMIGSIVFGLVGVVLNKFGWEVMALIVASITFVSLLPIAVIGKERNLTSGMKEGMSFLSSVVLVLKSKAFRHLVLGTSFYFLAFTCILISLPFWVKVYLGMGEEVVSYLMLPLLLITLILFLFVGMVVNRWGKYRVFSITLFLASVGLFLLAGVGLYPIGKPLHHLFGVIIWMSVPVAGLAVLPFAILTDVIDEDERRTGTRREAIFFAIQGTIQKIFIGCAGGLFSLLAYWGGGNNVTEMGLRLVAMTGGVSVLIGFFIFLGYPLKDVDVVRQSTMSDKLGGVE